MPFAPATTYAGWFMPEHTGISDDLDLLQAALEPAAGERFITVSSFGAGEAALALSSRGSKVTAYDIEDSGTLAQLLALKTAAATRLDRSDYLMLMGLVPATKSVRLHRLDVVVASLSPESQAYWAKRRRWFERGLYFANRQTFFLGVAWALLLGLTSKEIRERIFFAEAPEERRGLFREHVARSWLVAMAGWLGSHLNVFYPKSEWRNSDYPKYCARRMFPYLEELVAAGAPGNPLFAQYFQDRHAGVPDPLLPPHMRAGGYTGFKAAGRLISVINSPPGAVPQINLHRGSCHGAYLSNVIDYLGGDARTRLFRQIATVLAPGAPVLVYSSESYDKVPREVGLVLDEPASRKLMEQDRVRTYQRVNLYRVRGDCPIPAEPVSNGVPEVIACGMHRRGDGALS